MRRVRPWVTLTDPEAPADRLRFDRVRRWGRLCTWARHHGLHLVLLYNLERTGPAHVPPHLLEGLRTTRANAVARRLALAHAFRGVARALDRARVEALLLKGPAAARCYPSPNMRPSHDIDLLIRRADLDSARRAIEDLGYQDAEPEKAAEFIRRMGEMTYVLPNPMPVQVELHWRLINSPSLARGRPCDTEALMAAARTIDLEGFPARVPAGAQNLFSLAMHAAAGHQVRRLIWVLDIAQQLRRGADDVDWSAFVTLVQRERAALPAGHPLWLASHLYGVSAPAEVMRALAPHRGLRPWLAGRILGPARVSGMPGRCFDLCRIQFRQACKVRMKADPETVSCP